MVWEKLEPHIVWDIFENIIASTPRPSKHEDKIRETIKEWLVEQSHKKDLKLKLTEDTVGNILIKKEATEGFERVSPLLLQGHMDMVCETDRPNGYNFHQQGIPIRIQENNKWVDADGTTLGADNGIGVALALALIVDIQNKFSHGPLEILFTVNEEDGFTGAMNLDVKTLGIESKHMINLDSGPLGIITIGSVCGGRVFFEKKFDGEVIRIDELNIKTLKKFFENYNENFQDIDAIAIAVQDHGIPPVGISNRRFRIKIMKELLLENNDLFNLAFIDDKIPINFIRMRSAFKNSKEIIPNAKVIVTDTSFAAIQGCFCDPSVREDEFILVINLGNDHTMASIIKNRRIYGIMEHHTKLLNAKKLERFIRKFINGKLADNEIFNDGGHGAFYTSPIKSRIEFITVTGPNRDMIKETGLKHYFAVPGGDMMMTGPLGLVRATKELNLRGEN